MLLPCKSVKFHTQMENFIKEKKKRNQNRLMKVGKISLITKYDISGKVYIYIVVTKTNTLLY